MILTGTSSIIGSLAIELKRERSAISLKFTPGVSLTVDSEYRFDPSVVQAISLGLLDLTMEDSDFATQEDADSDGSGNSLPYSASTYISPEIGSSNTDNGLALIAAYNDAKTLTPGGEEKSTTNRVCILLLPAIYDLGTTSLDLDSDYIDIVGFGSGVLITSGVDDVNSGTITQSANDVKLINLNISNYAEITLNTDDSDPSAYFPENDTFVYAEKVAFSSTENAWSMRIGITYPGTFVDCSAGTRSFGGSGGVASGLFVRCSGGDHSFAGNGGNATGTFVDCNGTEHAFASEGTASGVFKRCSCSGEGSFGGLGGSASGTFTDCQGGFDSFGSRGTASGYFENCTGSIGAFGGISGTASGEFKNCAGDNNSFGGGGNGIASGTFTRCSGEDDSFGGGTCGQATGSFLFCIGTDGSFAGHYGSATGYFYNCLGGEYAFAGQSTAAGTFIKCVGDDYSFGGNGGTASGLFLDCHGGTGSLGGYGQASGTFSNCNVDNKYILETTSVTPILTSNRDENASNLYNAYNRAGNLAPYGTALDTDNRVVVFLKPGYYDFEGAYFEIEFDYVDIIGKAERNNIHIVSLDTKTIHQTASDIRIENFTIENVWSGSIANESTDPAAYYSENTGLATILKNIAFRTEGNASEGCSWPTRIGHDYSGQYSDCFSQRSGMFGGHSSTLASGTFTRCICEEAAFANGGTAHGIFIDCSGGSDSFGGNGGTASGTFKRCTAGEKAFGGYGEAGGWFEDCNADAESFGSYGVASGTFKRCRGTASSFGTGGVVSGALIDCTGGEDSFGSLGGSITGSLTRCITANQISGTLYGKMEDMHIQAVGTSVPAILVGQGAKIYNCTLIRTDSALSVQRGELGLTDSRDRGTIISMVLAVPPLSPTIGDTYIVGLSATLAWLGLDDLIVTWSGSFWTNESNIPNDLVYNNDDSTSYRWNGSDWVTNNDAIIAHCRMNSAIGADINNLIVEPYNVVSNYVA